MGRVMLLLILVLFSWGVAGVASPQEPTRLKKEHLPREMLPATIPPTADSLGAFRRIKGRMSMKEVVKMCGLPAKDIGSGIHIYVYELADRSEVRVGTPDGKRVLYVVHVSESGEEHELIRVKSNYKKDSARRRLARQ